MTQNNFIVTQMSLPQRVKALQFDKGDAIDQSGRYTFERKLGAGAMGKVFLFHDNTMGDSKALKTVDEILMQFPDAVEDLKRECKAMYALTHPNIVAVRDLVMDQWGYRYYIVMDYAEGETLYQYLRQHEKPDLAITREIVKRMASALDYAHGQGLVHRDVKPDNVMVNIVGENVKSVKLLDFGLGVQINRILSTMTGIEGKKGAPAYRSPEGWSSKRYGKVSARSDQYSLAAVAYEMLSGHCPFYGEFDDEVVLRGLVLDENEYPEKIAGVPDYVNDVLRKALSKRQKDRFTTCTEFAEALAKEPVLSSVQPQAVAPSAAIQPDVKTPKKKSKKRKWLWCVLALVGILALIAGTSAETEPAIRGEEVKSVPSIEKTKTVPIVEKSQPQPPENGNFKIMLTGGVPLEFIHIQKGEFKMGSPLDEPDRYYDEILHSVKLTKDFWLGKYPVTQAQWRAVMGTTLVDQANKAKPEEGEEYVGIIGDNYPIYWVNWDEAMTFCWKLTEAERSAGRLRAGYEYKLPTEAQWEYACRAGTTTALYSGDINILGSNNAPALDRIAWYGGNSSVGYSGQGWNTKDWKEKQYPGGLAGPREVGGKQPNDWGLYDMLGNVWEWCYDGTKFVGNKSEDIYKDDMIDPCIDSVHFARGGSWMQAAKSCRSSLRFSFEQSRRQIDLGFRVALVSVQ